MDGRTQERPCWKGHDDTLVFWDCDRLPLQDSLEYSREVSPQINSLQNNKTE